MKRLMTVVVMVTLSGGMLLAEDGGTLFKRCAMCHGATGEGKIGPSIRGKDAMPVLMNGGRKAPHNAKFSGYSDEQIKTVAEYVKALK